MWKGKKLEELFRFVWGHRGLLNDVLANIIYTGYFELANFEMSRLNQFFGRWTYTVLLRASGRASHVLGPLFKSLFLIPMT